VKLDSSLPVLYAAHLIIQNNIRVIINCPNMQ